MSFMHIAADKAVRFIWTCNVKLKGIIKLKNALTARLIRHSGHHMQTNQLPTVSNKAADTRTAEVRST
jgi:hypothetical protein